MKIFLFRKKFSSLQKSCNNSKYPDTHHLHLPNVTLLLGCFLCAEILFSSKCAAEGHNQIESSMPGLCFYRVAWVLVLLLASNY